MEDNKTYLLKYEVYFIDSDPLVEKEIKVKNCFSDLHAKCKLEDYLKRKYVNFKALIVNSCKEYYDLDSIFNFSNNDLNSIFGNIFNKK